MLPTQFDRFARLGDGIITTYIEAEDCRIVRERADEALARHGRNLPNFPLCVYTTVRFEDDVRTALKHQGMENFKFEPGDVVLFRTNWGRHWQDNARYNAGAPGISVVSCR